MACVLKHDDLVPVYKKETKGDTANERPVSIILNLSKIYEKLMYQQLYEYFKSTIGKWGGQVKTTKRETQNFMIWEL